MSAEEVAAEEGSKEASPVTSKRKWIIIGAVGLLLLLIIGGVASWLLIKKGGDEKTGHPAPAPEYKPVPASGPAPASKAESVPGFGNILALEPFVVNLADPGGKRLLRIRIEMELAGGMPQDEFAVKVPRLRDMILLLLSEKTMENIQKMEGKIALRNELITRINQILTTVKIRNLYFTEFVIQQSEP
ncbi:MAG: flagellar basal body-associated FliL family protein [Thermodesulfobacteriota bacterium]